MAKQCWGYRTTLWAIKNVAVISDCKSLKPQLILCSFIILITNDCCMQSQQNYAHHFKFVHYECIAYNIKIYRDQPQLQSNVNCHTFYDPQCIIRNVEYKDETVLVCSSVLSRPQIHNNTGFLSLIKS